MDRVQTSAAIDYLIIGGGLAGAMAAEAIRERGVGGRVVIVTEDHERPYHRPPLSKEYLRGDQDRKEVFVHPPEWYHEQGVELMAQTRATRLDPQTHQVTLEDGRTLEYKKLLLATGSTPKHLEIPGAELEGVHYLRWLDDSDGLRSAAARAKHAAVIGGSFIGVEVAAALVTYKVDTTVIVKGKTIWDRFIPEEIALFFQQTLADHGVTFLTEDEAVRILPQSGQMKAGRVATKKGHTVGGDLVVAGIGVNLNRGLADAALLAYHPETQGVKVNEYLQTSDPDIYAVGDIAAFPDPVFGMRRVEHWDTALSQGKTAGANMAGAKEPYDHVQYFFSDLFDLGIEVLGNPQPDAHVIVRGKMDDRSFAALYLDGSRDIVVGALTVNRPPEELDQYRVLIRQQASLRGFLREAEQHPDEDLTGLVPDLDAANQMLEASQEQA
jgi:3-phenylpropionate/trans-cinnamate dioxygenase ferredoxin reductase subunit